MEPNESGLTSYFHQHHQQQQHQQQHQQQQQQQQQHHHHHHQHQQPSTTPSYHAPTSSAAAAAANTSASPTTNGLSDAAAGVLYPHSVAGKAPPVEPQRRKRGRPRKYGTPEAAAAAKRAYVPAAIKRKEQHFLSGAGGSSNSPSSSSKKPNLASVGGQGFTPHVINVATGEDVGQKIMSFMQQTGWELCILSASGSVSNASLRQPSVSGGSVAYEGRFDIISLTGSYVRSELGGKAGGLSACLSSTNGQIVGGGVGGPLIAAGPVEVIVATFVIDPKKDGNGGFKGNAPASKMPSPLAASTAVYRPVVESSGGFAVSGGNDHQNMDGSPFMMQPQWRGGMDYDLGGNAGHDTHDSPENGDYEQMPD